MVTSRRNPVVAATSVDAHQISTQSRQAAAGSSISGSRDGNGWRSSDSELLFTSVPTAPPANATSSSHSQAATHQINSLQQQQQHSDSSGSSSSRFSSDSELLFTSAPTARSAAAAAATSTPPRCRCKATRDFVHAAEIPRLTTSAAPGVYYSRPGSSEFGLIRELSCTDAPGLLPLLTSSDWSGSCRSPMHLAFPLLLRRMCPGRSGSCRLPMHLVLVDACDFGPRMLSTRTGHSHGMGDAMQAHAEWYGMGRTRHGVRR